MELFLHTGGNALTERWLGEKCHVRITSVLQRQGMSTEILNAVIKPEKEVAGKKRFEIFGAKNKTNCSYSAQKNQLYFIEALSLCVYSKITKTSLMPTRLDDTAHVTQNK